MNYVRSRIRLGRGSFEERYQWSAPILVYGGVATVLALLILFASLGAGKAMSQMVVDSGENAAAIEPVAALPAVRSWKSDVFRSWE